MERRIWRDDCLQTFLWTSTSVVLNLEFVLFTRLASSNAAPSLDVGLLVGERLVHCYANLYSQARVDTLDALDNLHQLDNATELKSKILFSVIVVRHHHHVDRQSQFASCEILFFHLLFCFLLFISFFLCFWFR